MERTVIKRRRRRRIGEISFSSVERRNGILSIGAFSFFIIISGICFYKQEKTLENQGIPSYKQAVEKEYPNLPQEIKECMVRRRNGSFSRKDHKKFPQQTLEDFGACLNDEMNNKINQEFLNQFSKKN